MYTSITMMTMEILHACTKSSTSGKFKKQKLWQFDIFEYTDIWFYLEIAIRICAITSDLKWKV